jgi:hypothetical protein
VVLVVETVLTLAARKKDQNQSSRVGLGFASVPLEGKIGKNIKVPM